MTAYCLRTVVALFVVLICASRAPVYAQAAQSQPPEKEPLGWSNTTDMSLVMTGGNSSTSTLGFSNKLRHVWSDARSEFEITTVRAHTSDDRYFLVNPGIEFPVGGAPANPATTVVTPDPTLDVATYLVRGGYEKNISPRLFWNTGASWYRNEDAGILNRYIAFAGVGNNWIDNERRRFATSYGVSYTDREEEQLDPDKDRRFAGSRLGWDYTERINAGTTFDSDFAMNINFSDASDYSINTVNALTVAVNTHISLKVSLQWLFENEPALESGLDIIAYVDLVNPDGLPGTGDERFRTLSSGGTTLVIGSSEARKEKLDTVFQTALVIKF